MTFARFAFARFSRAALALMMACAVIAASAAPAPPAVATGDVISALPPAVDVTFDPVASDFDRPVFVTHAGDSRLFVVEQEGVIKIVKDGATLPTPFLSITREVQCCGEQGLLGLAFEPNYQTTGHFYVYHTVLRDGKTDQVIARYRVSASNPDVADPGTRQEVLYIPHHRVVGGNLEDNGNHNGGWIGFGPDSFLYAGVGDGGGGGDPFCAGQSVSTLLGKILRLDVSGQVTYTVPASNTFATGQTPEVWAFGLRNPWRASFDRQTGELFIGDVGQGEREEISYLPANAAAGTNFGWNRFEGNRAYSTSCPASAITPTAPITDYARSAGTSVTGGYVYRGTAYPWLSGVYFYADFGSGRLFAAWRPSAGAPFTSKSLSDDVGFNPSSFGEDVNGELYVAGYGGTVYQLKSTFRGQLLYLPSVLKQ